MHTLTLPASIAACFAADARHPEALARCFTAGAIVKDEGRTYSGLDAFASWKAVSSTKYSYTVEPIALDQEGDSQVVRGRVSGDFPGSPVDHRYRFGLERGLIASLEITA